MRMNQRRIGWLKRLAEKTPALLFSIQASPQRHMDFDGSGMLRGGGQGLSGPTTTNQRPRGRARRRGRARPCVGRDGWPFVRHQRSISPRSTSVVAGPCLAFTRVWCNRFASTPSERRWRAFPAFSVVGGRRRYAGDHAKVGTNLHRRIWPVKRKLRTEQRRSHRSRWPYGPANDSPMVCHFTDEARVQLALTVAGVATLWVATLSPQE